jgi:OmcA/MtrC family decaheme c-type cytochrome
MGKSGFRSWRLWVTSVFVVAALAACGGDDGATGPQGPDGPAGPTGPTGPGSPSGGRLDVTTITPEAWATANFSSSVNSVTIANPPVVEFTVSDEQGRGVVGLEKLTSKSATAAMAQYPNVSFALAKLMPRTDAKPSSWVSYIVTTVPTASNANSVPTRPGTDNTGTLEAVADKPGTYKYTFYRDVPAIKNQVDAFAFSGNNRREDLGDLSWQPNLPHRLTIQISGAAPGTGSNTPNGVTVTPAVDMGNPVNVTYDFVPATGQVLTPDQLTRENVNIDSCNVCHEKLAFHGGSARVETRYCVVCHTDQRAYGRAKATSTDSRFPPLTETARVNPDTGITSFSYTPNTYVADGEVAGDFVTMIHKIHQGHNLVKANYHYAGIAFNNKGFSKLGGGQRMCSTCHDSNIAATADNFNKLPSRQACGACHDGIDWATGTGPTLADKAAHAASTDARPVGLATSGHAGGAAADDSSCSSCHTAEYIKVSHRMENITKNNPEITPGLATFTYEIRSVSVNASNDTAIEFGIKVRIAPSTTDEWVTLPLAGFTGGPSFLLAYALPQDGITAPADYNNLGRTSAQPLSVPLANLMNPSQAANGSVAPSAANPGYYIATLKGSGNWKFPVGATLRAVALQGYYTQVSGPAAPPADPVARHAISVVKAVTGDPVRRTVVDAEKCSNCHEWFEAHGGNRVKETQVCAVCHVPGLATSGRGVPDSLLNTWGNFTAADKRLLADWSFDKTVPNAALNFPVTTNNLKDMIHGIHAGRQRVVPFQDARDSTSRGALTLLDFRRMDFPGKLENCETCHVTATASSMTYSTVPTNALMSTYESIDANYAAAILAANATPAMAKSSLATASDTDTVVTPFSAACVSCHDNGMAKLHMTLNGGAIGVPRSTAVAKVESCATCHGPGKTYDAATIHK